MQWARDADRVLREHGAVSGSEVYEARHRARYRAQKLMTLMVELGLHDRGALREHTELRRGGWGWSVEFVAR